MLSGILFIILTIGIVLPIIIGTIAYVIEVIKEACK